MWVALGQFLKRKKLFRESSVRGESLRQSKGAAIAATN